MGPWRCDAAPLVGFQTFSLEPALSPSPFTPPTIAPPPSMPPKQVDIEAALDQQRSRLEESITKLRKALSTWQNWSAEYEAFREELQTLPEDASREDMVGPIDRFLSYCGIEGLISAL